MEFLEEAPDDQIMALADFIDEGEVAHLVDDSDSASLAVGVTMMSKVPHTVLVDILSESVANLKGKKVLKNCKLKDPKILIKLRNLKYMVPGTFAMRGGAITVDFQESYGCVRQGFGSAGTLNNGWWRGKQ